MRILLFTEVYNCGGIDTFIVNLIKNWPDDRDTFILVANSDYPGLRIIEACLKNRCLVIRHTMKLYANTLNGRFIFKVVRKLLSPVLRYLFIFKNVLEMRSILLRADADALMIVNGGYPAGDSCRAAAISWGIYSGKPKSIHNFHNIATKPSWYSMIQENIVDRLVSTYTDKFVTVSCAAARSITVRPMIARKNMTTYIHNGLGAIDEESSSGEIAIREEIGVESGVPLCLMLGSYEARKGHHFLLEAFVRVLEEVPSAHLLICGYGSRNEIEVVCGYVREFQLENHVHLRGFRTDIAKMLRTTDVLVVASQEYESFGFTSLEAMAHKVPVVATNVGGIPEVVVNNEGGYCVASTDVSSYAKCIVKLLKDDIFRREQGELGYRRYRTLFSAEAMASKYAEVIHGFPK